MFRTDDDKLIFVVTKVEHSKWYEGESLEKKFGFPGDKKSVWKSAIILLEVTGLKFKDEIKSFLESTNNSTIRKKLKNGVINLTQGGLKTIEGLEKLENERREGAISETQ